tara:strand:- start:5427 stop:5702 length:276 start_codon:yes stop_codon:yes gene_type:complete
MSIKDEMVKTLKADFDPAVLELQDQSDRHIGHAGHDGRGESHFHLKMATDKFKGMSRIQKHQAVNKSLEAFLSGRVHALSMELYLPSDLED